MFGKKGSKILKLPPVRNCFTLAMTNKLVVIINSKIKKILLYEMKFLVPNYSCLQNPWLEGNRPQIPVFSVLCPQLNLLNPPEQNSWVRHWLQSEILVTITPASKDLLHYHVNAGLGATYGPFFTCYQAWCTARSWMHLRVPWIYSPFILDKGKGKLRSRTGHEDLEGENIIDLFFL